MLTGNLVRVRFRRNRIIPCYIDSNDLDWRAAAEQLCQLYRTGAGRTRGELEDDCRDLIAGHPQSRVFQGLGKLVEDRCTFEVVAGRPPEELRERVFAAATAARRAAAQGSAGSFDREAVLEQVANELGVSAADIEAGL
ncbi:MAG: DUF790 family protein, partial [Gemmataceae bacterium]|nr:DUF790 family protein [Gemmataceae bacterium]